MEGGGGNGGLGRRRWERFALPFLVDGWMDGKSGHPHAVMGCCVPTTTSSLPSSVPPSFSPPTASIIPSDAPSFSATTSVPPPGISSTHFPIAQRISFGTIPFHLNPRPGIGCLLFRQQQPPPNIILLGCMIERLALACFRYSTLAFSNLF